MTSEVTAKVAAWLAGLHEEATASEAARGLAGLGPNDHEAVPQLIAELAHARCPHRQVVAQALGQIGETAAAAAPTLGLCLDGEDDLRCQAALALGSLGVAEPALVAKLRGLLADRDAVVRAAAASALLRLAPPAGEAMALLQRLWQEEENVGIRYWAACGLAEASKTVAEVRPVILKMLRTEWNDELWEVAMRHFQECDPLTLLPLILTALRDQSDYRQMYLLGLLAEMGERVRPAAPAILEAFQETQVFRGSDSRIRSHAALAAGAIPLECAYVIDELRPLLEDDYDKFVAEYAAQTLLRFATTPPDLRAAAADVLHRIRAQRRASKTDN
jgi:HEAT repeat protein